ncbi:MAG: hypothetical protein QXW37_06715 [Candidatus Nitrosotenuis sp.]
MMKNSKDQLDRLLSGYLYYVYAKELRSDDPANYSHHVLFENWMQKKNDAYAIHNHDDFYRCTKSYIRRKTREKQYALDHASMYVIKFVSKETCLDIDEISLFVTPLGVSANLFRKISGIKKLDSYIITFMGENFIHHPQLARIERDLNRKIRDALVWSDFGAGFDSRMVREVVLDYNSISDEEGVIMGIVTIKVSDVSELPTLPMLNKALDGLEKIVRDDLE